MEDIQSEDRDMEQCVTPQQKIDEIDPDGDIEFVLPESDESGHHRLIVSSKVLGLASPVFKALFSPHFHEGSALRDAKRPCPIVLEEEHGAAMGVICSILHHQLEDVPKAPDLSLLCAIAQSTDKWDCVEPLKLWGETWLRDWRRLVDHPPHTWSVLLAAYRFDNCQAFSEVTSHIVKSSARNSDYFDQNNADDSFPDRLIVDLMGQRDAISAAISHEIELAVVTLQGYKKAYQMRKKVCDSCGKVLPDEAKKCHPCDNTAFGILFCNTDSRIALYLETLRKVGLWPLQDAISTCGIDQVVSKLSSMSQFCPHLCEGHELCPIKIVIVDLIRAVWQKQKSACGLCLDCLKEHRQSRRDMASAEGKCRSPHSFGTLTANKLWK